MTPLHVLLVVFNIAVIWLYVPINRLVQGGIKPILSIDASIPLLPIFVLPYLLYHPWIMYLNISYLFRPLAELQQLTVATLVACGIGYLCFILMPTYVTCTYPQGSGVLYRLLQFLHRIDQPNNACPSMHVYLAVLLGYFSWTESSFANVFVLLAAVSVAISTVLIKRHYVLDVVGGVAVGIVALAATHLLL